MIELDYTEYNLVETKLIELGKYDEIISSTKMLAESFNLSEEVYEVLKEIVIMSFGKGYIIANTVNLTSLIESFSNDKISHEATEFMCNLLKQNNI